MSRVITEQWAEGALSAAYSDLKDKHVDLQRSYRNLKSRIKDLQSELHDINDRYLQLTKYVNNLPEQTGIIQ